jgi:hypothetical protein
MADVAPESMYLLKDGTYADKGSCKEDDKGVMCAENGVPVAMNDDGSPMTMAHVKEDNEMAKEAGKPKEPVEGEAEEANAVADADKPAPATPTPAEARRGATVAEGEEKVTPKAEPKVEHTAARHEAPKSR